MALENFPYQKLADLATTLLTIFGLDIVITRRTQTYNESTGSMTGATVTTQVAKAAKPPMSKVSDRFLRENDSFIDESKYAFFVIDTSKLTEGIKAGDVISTSDGSEYVIYKYTPVEPAYTTIVQKVLARIKTELN